MALSHSDVRQLLDLLDRAENLDSLSIRLGDFVLQAHKSGSAGAQPPIGGLHTTTAGTSASQPWLAAPAAEPAPPVPADSDVPEGMMAIRAPMLGTFYRTPAPDEPAFVDEDSTVAADATLCLVEVMKMFNTVKAPVAGRVHRILAEHGKLVQHDQILMLLEPELKS